MLAWRCPCRYQRLSERIPFLEEGTYYDALSTSDFFPCSSELDVPDVPQDRLPVLGRIAERGISAVALLEFVCLLLDQARALEEIPHLRNALKQIAHIKHFDRKPPIPPKPPFEEFHRSVLRGNVMPSMEWFDPCETPTWEVVYRGIVPLTKYVKTSCSPILMGGSQDYPNAIITHTWGNKFIHTVAACVADALDKPYYFHIIPYLKSYNGTRLLIRMLNKHGAATKKYWMCFMCINQHLTRCDQEGGCDCGLPKNTDDEHPDCEVGHFHHMMSFIVTKMPSFYQVIAVDKDGKVFTRVWAVAEIAQVQLSGLKQQIKFHLPLGHADEKLRDSMENIDVNKCEATEPADKTRILGMIADKDAYNKRVKEALVHFIFKSENAGHVWGAIWSISVGVALVCSLIVLMALAFHISLPGESIFKWSTSFFAVALLIVSYLGYCRLIKDGQVAFIYDEFWDILQADTRMRKTYNRSRYDRIPDCRLIQDFHNELVEWPEGYERIANVSDRCSSFRYGVRRQQWGHIVAESRCEQCLKNSWLLLLSAGFLVIAYAVLAFALYAKLNRHEHHIWAIMAIVPVVVICLVCVIALPLLAILGLINAACILLDFMYCDCCFRRLDDDSDPDAYT